MQVWCEPCELILCKYITERLQNRGCNRKIKMASGDTDHIEVMDSSASKKSDNATGPSGAEEDGSTLLNPIIQERIPLL